MIDSCHRGHALVEPRDRLPNGTCRQCGIEAAAKHRARSRAGLDLLKAYEMCGGRIEDVGDPKLRIRIALAAVSECSPEQLLHAALLDPDLAARALARLDG